MDVNVEDLTVLVLTVSPAKEFTSQGTACYLSRMTVKKVVGWERNGEKCPAGRFHSYLWARKVICKSSNPNFISHLSCVSTSCLILIFLCPPTHNSSCCPLILLQLPITPTHIPVCNWYLSSHVPLKCPFPLKCSPVTLLSSLPVLLFPLSCSSPVAQPLSQITAVLFNLGLFSLAPATPPMSFVHFTSVVLPISCVWPSLLRLYSSLESSHIFLYWFILQSGSFSISPSFSCLDASRGSGLHSSESVAAFSLAPATAGTWMRCTISRDGRALISSDVIPCSKFS